MKSSQGFVGRALTALDDLVLGLPPSLWTVPGLSRRFHGKVENAALEDLGSETRDPDTEIAWLQKKDMLDVPLGEEDPDMVGPLYDGGFD